ncbi:MotE family protein [Parvibaculum sp.]|jgi:flagellar motility protein MotE (MotC chaperone)|uniref:MotE family protein n=1 Tax=Parvibaculum sp. TaxID=2024848 RepID=UPI003C787E52
MLNRLRLLPTVILCASLLLTLKLADLASGGSAISAAQASATEPVAEEVTSAQSAPVAAGEAPVEPATETFSKSEVTVLESLSARREELDRRAKLLDTREQLLNAAEKRVEERIAELKDIEARINARIGVQDEQNENRLAGVVSMYETMKPKDAARIFERLDMGVLLEVAKRMEPRKLSAVLAQMDPVSAQDLTVELALGEKLDDIVQGAEKAEGAGDGAFSAEKAS